ncbi:hypothetical protein [Micromonospora pallida]|uniref:hypothetical protein n=1 Tax=Micromonospora pallida TaxID=145854 RepID=UPI00114CEB18|nr:hypothetical protein [Micromonospora pallida]
MPHRQDVHPEDAGRDRANRRGAYLAYNKSIATDAAKEFPSSVTCKTAHSFAYGRLPAVRPRLNGPRIPARQARSSSA